MSKSSKTRATRAMGDQGVVATPSNSIDAPTASSGGAKARNARKAVAKKTGSGKKARSKAAGAAASTAGRASGTGSAKSRPAAKPSATTERRQTVSNAGSLPAASPAPTAAKAATSKTRPTKSSAAASPGASVRAKATPAKASAAKSAATKTAAAPPAQSAAAKKPGTPQRGSSGKPKSGNPSKRSSAATGSGVFIDDRLTAPQAKRYLVSVADAPVTLHDGENGPSAPVSRKIGQAIKAAIRGLAATAAAASKKDLAKNPSDNFTAGRKDGCAASGKATGARLPHQARSAGEAEAGQIRFAAATADRETTPAEVRRFPPSISGQGKEQMTRMYFEKQQRWGYQVRQSREVVGVLLFENKDKWLLTPSSKKLAKAGVGPSVHRNPIGAFIQIQQFWHPALAPPQKKASRRLRIQGKSQGLGLLRVLGISFRLLPGPSNQVFVFINMASVHSLFLENEGKHSLVNF